MSVAPTVARELLRSGVEFQLLHHVTARHSLEAARVARVPAGRVAKAVLLTYEKGHVVGVVPAVSTLDFRLLERRLGRNLWLAKETETGLVFHDCVRGAVPPLGTAYGVETWLDERVLDGPDVFFDAGDHQLLVRMQAQDFLAVMEGANVARFARPALTAGAKRSHPAGTPRPSPYPASRR